MSDATSSPGFARINAMRHACAFFAGEEESYRILLPYIVEGFACGHKAIHIIPGSREQQHLDSLRDAGVDVETGLQTGQLELRKDEEVYLDDGRFDPERMLAAFEAMATPAAGGDFPLSRIICRMDWAIAHDARPEDLIGFEARVNDVWRRHPDVVICVYPLDRLSGAMVIDIMRTHPLVLIGNSLQENPFYTPPDRFLAERDASRAEIPGP